MTNPRSIWSKLKSRLPVIDDGATTTTTPSLQRKIGRLKVESFDDASVPAPTSGSEGVDAGVPVKKSSRAINPRQQFPLHFDLLMRDIHQRGQVPEHWHVIAAKEVRLDEMNMDVEFTLMDDRTQAVVRRRVEVQAGRLLKIQDC